MKFADLVSTPVFSMGIKLRRGRKIDWAAIAALEPAGEQSAEEPDSDQAEAIAAIGAEINALGRLAEETEEQRAARMFADFEREQRNRIREERDRIAREQAREAEQLAAERQQAEALARERTRLQKKALEKWRLESANRERQNERARLNKIATEWGSFQQGLSEQQRQAELQRRFAHIDNLFAEDWRGTPAPWTVAGRLAALEQSVSELEPIDEDDFPRVPWR